MLTLIFGVYALSLLAALWIALPVDVAVWAMSGFYLSLAPCAVSYPWPCPMSGRA